MPLSTRRRDIGRERIKVAAGHRDRMIAAMSFVRSTVAALPKHRADLVADTVTDYLIGIAEDQYPEEKPR